MDAVDPQAAWSPPAIGDHALIGDGRAAALVTRDGTIDWLCWPRFDAPSLFGAILDPARGGAWRIAPVGPFRAERRYLEGTNVLETRFQAEGGAALLTDAMPVYTRAETARELAPEHELLRVVRCVEGAIAVSVTFEPRPGYGQQELRLLEPAPGLLCADMGTIGRLVLRSSQRLEIDGGVARGVVRLRRGEALYLSLSASCRTPAVLVPVGEWTEATVQRTVDWWRSWSGRLRYEGPHRAAVERSALVLRALTYPPSGAIVAAPTASLPERMGGDLNWDYRYCWLRDAALTARALHGLGYVDEGAAFVGWLLHTTRLTRPALRVLYDLFGERPPAERTLEHLRGYRGSRPVRVGNAAEEQLQLDTYGEVIEAVFLQCGAGGTLDRTTGRMLLDFGRYVCEHWRQPDHGIWEPRGEPRRYVHSHVLCWVALDRLLRLADAGLLAMPARLRGKFVADRDAIRREVEVHGWNEGAQTYTQVLDGRAVDASLLLLSWYGFHPAEHPRMRATAARIRDELGAGEGLLYRYAPDPQAPEGAFGICSFWAVEQLARGGSLDEATALFERLCELGNDVGLYGEEFDPHDDGAPLGNFPQAFTHIGLINAALTLEEQARGGSGSARERVRAGAAEGGPGAVA